MRTIARFFETFRHHDWVLTITTVLLTAIGLSAIYSIDLSRGGPLVLTPRQVVAASLGILLIFLFGSIHVSIYRRSAKLWYVVALILLAAVLIFGTTIRGTTGWFRVAGVSFQPVEFAKIALILFLAFLIHRHARQFDRIEFLLSTLLAMAILAGFVLLQPDTGSALILAAIWFGMFALTKTRPRYLLGVIFGGVALAGIAWLFVLAPYQKDRVWAFLQPGAETTNAGYNLEQSIIAIGSGQFTGRGLGSGSQSQLHFLPEAQTDFIFAAIGEELGFVGAFAVVILFVILIGRLFFIATKATDDFEAYVVIGIAILLFVHCFINIGGVLRLLPLTGVTLPFLSYGGSSLLMNFLLLGIAQSIASRRERGSSV